MGQMHPGVCRSLGGGGKTEVTSRDWVRLGKGPPFACPSSRAAPLGVSLPESELLVVLPLRRRRTGP